STPAPKWWRKVTSPYGVHSEVLHAPDVVATMMLRSMHCDCNRFKFGSASPLLAHPTNIGCTTTITTGRKRLVWLTERSKYSNSIPNFEKFFQVIPQLIN